MAIQPKGFTFESARVQVRKSSSKEGFNSDEFNSDDFISEGRNLAAGKWEEEEETRLRGGKKGEKR